LIDLLKNQNHNLQTGAYHFTSTNGINNNRFRIKYSNETLGTSTAELQNLVAYTNNETLHVKSGGEVLEQIEIFDLQGRRLFLFDQIQESQVSYQLNIASQIILVKCKSLDGKTTTKKLVF